MLREGERPIYVSVTLYDHLVWMTLKCVHPNVTEEVMLAEENKKSGRSALDGKNQKTLRGVTTKMSY